jgi:hypothetical protein
MAGDSNTWGCIPLTAAHPPRRYGPPQRWPGVLRRELGDGFWVVEEGMNGRPERPLRGGRARHRGRRWITARHCSRQRLRPGGVASAGTPRLSTPLGRLGLVAEEFAGAVERSRDLARHCAAVADARSCPWIDAGAHVRSSDDDGIHLDAPNHEQLGVVVAQQVRRLLP